LRKAITISIPESIEKEVDKAASEDGVSRSDLVRESLVKYLYFRKLGKLRERMRLKAEARGVFTDEDVFSRL
jgi:metal-responsive CopG/Arc/MetJ family transcriptional regulator